MRQHEQKITDEQFCLLLDAAAYLIKERADQMDDAELRRFMSYMAESSDAQHEQYLCTTFMRVLSVEEHSKDREFWLRAVLCSSKTIQQRIKSMLAFGSTHKNGDHYDEFAGNALNSLAALEALTSELT